MSKFLFFLSLSFVFLSCESEGKKLDFDRNQNYKIQGKGFWNTAFVDAAGALGGAGSVASVAGWLGWTPAAPVAAGAVLLGAIVGGAGASIAYADSYEVPIENDYAFSQSMIINDNYVDEIGAIHNQIVIDYKEKYAFYNEEAYFSFLETNKEQYGFTAPLLISNKVKEDIEKLKSASHSDVIEYTLELLPKEIDQEMYIDFFQHLEVLSAKEDAISFIKKFERSELIKQEYSDETKLLLGVYFSTLRYSLFLWNE
ncbi:hypothetical protein [Myroides odoratus]|uniref:hypothetical protein n=1 Tax=Myroides odoratus TaxID=256 RepID=UPI00333F04C7